MVSSYYIGLCYAVYMYLINNAYYAIYTQEEVLDYRLYNGILWCIDVGGCPSNCLGNN